MLRVLAERCTDVLINHETIQKDKKNIYIYGFELFWSTTFCVLSILTLSILLGYFKLAVTFLLFFMPVRVAAGGYHAKSYGRCFILTNSVAIICVAAAKLLWQIGIGEVILWLLFACAQVYIWMSAPAQTKGHPLRPDRIKKNRHYAHIIIVIETIILLLQRCAFNDSIVYTGSVTSWAVAIMIKLVKKGG